MNCLCQTSIERPFDN